MQGRGAIYGWVMAITFGSLGAAFLLRWTLKPVLRARGLRRAEELVDQWWVWAPVVAAAGIVWIYGGWVIGLVASAGAVALMRCWDTLYPALRRRQIPDP